MTNEELLEALNKRFDAIDSRLEKIEEDVSNLETDVSTLKDYVSVLKGDVSSLKETSEITRAGVNSLLDWAEECGNVIKFPLPKVK